MYQIGDKYWELPLVERHEATVALELGLAKTLDRDWWELEDIHEVSQMIETMPVVKEVVLELLLIVTK